MKKSLLLSCGDISGDLWASQIVFLLRERRPGVEVVALGGEESRKAGARLLVDTVSYSTVGLSEALRALSFWKKTWREASAFLRKEKPSVLLAIDNPGFNLRLVRLCAREGIPVVYFAPPQVWAWGRWRGRFLARCADHILHLFPWEGRYFLGGRAHVSWVGHPLGAWWGKIPQRGPNPQTILFLPGSRRNEILSFLPVLRGFLSEYGRHFSGYRLVIVAASFSLRPLLEAGRGSFPVQVVDRKDLYPLFEDTVLAVSSSGTVTLEVALGGIPQIVVYRTSWGTFLLGCLLFRAPFIGLPNILLGQEVAPELVQGRFTPTELFRTMERLLADSSLPQRAKGWAEEIALQLGDGRTFERVAEVVARYLE
ncbi:lipid-A-disaccharide synthase [Candidatus Caldatribacterium sp. SIUC1]|uniref:lipid-A-disaccharide synthase n=1 Tax=Candidatus Caldatribacterium sp. SIUC1 TaxID=3418365 RepID=UPI003F692D52